MNSTDRASLQHFIRAELGCQCPEEVFDSIAIERDCALGLSTPCMRIVVGHRLLIYVVETVSGIVAPEDVAHFAVRGRAERDARGFNRFRLVMASEHPAELYAQACDSFARIAGHDERAHLHVLALDRLPRVLQLGHCRK